ncbi:hypothetical protein [Croceicoccus naphthovorans]|uniref:Uncharacterized protein n=1 Tax=Croceicoccus naphthovorans TaxID=1348774 RepID=A0A0G3XJJ2_9SPHN|nr:hypothetical protein [Croceicoccus naphthovorans]AKM10523.1 hypothetical protein AB433_12010 [Croceicoccus naphthovorans]MBB3988715.1 hypothetical protein [Croceicoccus naphthovorans]
MPDLLRREGVALAALLSLGACSHDITRLGHGCAGPGGWCPDARRVADASWEYAQLAQNAYWEEAETSDKYLDRPYVLPEELKERYAAANDRYGFAYTIFDRFDADDRLSEVVLVYRGTEGPKDWWHGTLLGRQGPRGVAIYRMVRDAMDRAGYADVPITVAGHSLGGRIADHVLKKVAREDGALPETLSSYLFNPNASGNALTKPEDWSRPVHVSIAESGEIAGWVRAFSSDPEWDGYAIDCQTSANPIANHYMRRLADCLTWVAALDDPAAKRSALRNELEPPPAQGATMAAGGG